MQILSELINRFVNEEKIILNTSPVTHPVLIGQMYEGLTKDILDKIDLSHHELKVVSGIIRAGEFQSGEIDCMIVMGNGDKIPYTDKFYYSIDKVVAVFEIKKNLFSREINDAYQHLDEVFQLSKINCQLKQDAGTLNFDTTRAAHEFLNLFAKWPPRYEDNSSLPLHQRVIYHSLVRDWLSPLRIAIGYNGFKSEEALRKGVIKIYDNKELMSGYGVQNMPNLMISDGYSIIKTNGMPYKGSWEEEKGWCWLASSDTNPILLIMELLFDRVQLLLGIKPERGMDQKEEVLYPLAFGKVVVQDDKVKGWSIGCVEAKIPLRENSQTEWAPLELSLSEKEFLKLVHEYGPQYLRTSRLNSFLSRHGIEDIFHFTQSLRYARVILVMDDQFSICSGDWAVAKVNGVFYCGDNAGDRFKNWVWLHTLPPYKINKLIQISPSMYGPPTVGPIRG